MGEGQLTDSPMLGENTGNLQRGVVGKIKYCKRIANYFTIAILLAIVEQTKPRKGAIVMTQITLRIDETTKILAEQTCEELGLSMTAAITIFLKKMGRERRIPFEVSVDPFYSDSNMERLRASIAQMEATGGTVHEVNFDD